MKIEGCVALVTGANRGLGAAFADLLDRGAAKVYAAVRDVSSVADRRLIALRLDLTDRASIEEAAGGAADVAVLINNAGVAPTHRRPPTRRACARSSRSTTSARSPSAARSRPCSAPTAEGRSSTSSRGWRA